MADEDNNTTSTHGDDDDTIHKLAENCKTLLRSGRSTSESRQSSVSTLFEKHAQRFAAWADHLGVFAKSGISLDRRLQHHPDMQDLIVRLLDILHTNLAYCKPQDTPQGSRCQLNRL
jgi:hypothetical protein